MTESRSGQDPKAIEANRQRERALSADRRRVLALPPEQALDAVLSHPYPVTLVQSMAEEDLYLLVHTIGPDDALPVLGLASNAQWEYFLDMEVWSRDRIHAHQLTGWLARLLQADPDRFTHWIAGEQRGLFEYYLFRNIQLHVREYEEDPAEIGDGFTSEDDVHYLRMRPYPALHKQEQSVRDQFLGDLLRRLSVYDFPLYRDLLLASTGVIGAETEEEMLRLRNVRLAEKGFLPFDEAVGVYQPLTLDELSRRVRKPSSGGGRPVESYPLPSAGGKGGAEIGRFARLLSQIQDEVVLQRLQAEFAALCNQVIVADLQQVRERASLARVVEKVAGYIGIGLEAAEVRDEGADPYRAANLLHRHLLADIFRVGYGRALQLKWRADRWRQESWFEQAGWPLSFWGEAWLGVLGGLLIKKPLFYDNFSTGVLYRDFASLDDIRTTDAVLTQIMAADELIRAMGVGASKQDTEGLITFQNLLLTGWAHHVCGTAPSQPMPTPMPVARFRDFFESLWQEALKPRRIKDAMRQNLLDWLATRSGWPTAYAAERFGFLVDDLCARIEAELGDVVARDIDARYVQQLFLLKENYS